MGKLLVVDDEPSICAMLSIMFEKQGHSVKSCTSAQKALASIQDENEFDVLISDIKMPEMDGLELLKSVKNINPNLPVILITAHDNKETAVSALKHGAEDYIVKPWKKEELRFLVERAIRNRRLKEENLILKQELQTHYRFENIIGNSKKIRNIWGTIRKVADLDATVLITGESGTGKELIASAIHYAGARKEKPFVTVNCGALPESLLESELFGHKKGAFTGAYQNKPGLCEVAHTGTVFLDEIGEISPSFQIKLLRFLNDKKLKRLGSVDDITVDVRVIAATNKDLQAAVNEDKFRQDLFYRLNVIPIHVPPLRERKEDVPLLAEFFLQKYCERCRCELKRCSSEAINLMIEYKWPGNVRELENVIERTVALEPKPLIIPESLPPEIRQAGRKKYYSINDIEKEPASLDDILSNIEKNILVDALKKTDGVKMKAAEYLKISFRSLRYRLQKHGLGDNNNVDETKEL